MTNKWVTRFVMAFVMVLGVSTIANAQITNPATAQVQIQASKQESLTISADSLTPFVISGTSSTTSQPLNIHTNWNLTPQRNSVTVCTYMAASDVMKGTGTNTDVIDQSMVQTKVGAGSWTAINAGTGCAASGGATVVKTYTMGAPPTYKNVSNTDTVQLQLNGLDANLAADTYTGKITVAAYVQ